MAKDRARPFSRKHRKYWFTVTGGMLIIGAINLALGFSAYDPPPPPPQPIVPVLPVAQVAPGTISFGDVPAPVLQAAAAAFARMRPHEARRLTSDDGAVRYELTYADGARRVTATYLPDGARLPAP